MDYITDVEPSGSDAVSCKVDEEPPSKKKKSGESWKEKYFESIVNVEEKLSDPEIKKKQLKAYHTLLKCIKLEEELKLKEYEISYLRVTISTTLNEYPSHHSTYEVEQISHE